MKTLIIKSLFCFLFIFAYFSIYGQTESGNFEMSPKLEDDKQAADIITITPLTSFQSEDVAETELNPDNAFTVYDENVAGVGLSTDINRSSSIYKLPLSYGFKTKFLKNEGIKERLTFKALLPLVRKVVSVASFNYDANTGISTQSEEDLKTMGLGDICVKAQYLIALDKTIFSTGLAVKLPTGKAENNVDDKAIIPLGSGSTDIGISANARRSLNNSSISLNVVYDMLGTFTRKTSDEYSDTDTDYNYGNKIFISTRYSYLKFDKISGGASLFFLSTSDTKTTIIYKNRDGTIFENDFRSAGIKTLDFAPYIKIKLPFKSSLNLKVTVPLVTKFNEANDVEIKNPKRGIKVSVGLRVYLVSLKVK